MDVKNGLPAIVFMVDYGTESGIMHVFLFGNPLNNCQRGPASGLFASIIDGVWHAGLPVRAREPAR